MDIKKKKKLRLTWCNYIYALNCFIFLKILKMHPESLWINRTGMSYRVKFIQKDFTIEMHCCGDMVWLPQGYMGHVLLSSSYRGPHCILTTLWKIYIKENFCLHLFVITELSRHKKQPNSLNINITSNMFIGIT